LALYCPISIFVVSIIPLKKIKMNVALKKIALLFVFGLALLVFAACTEQPQPVVEALVEKAPPELIINLISDPTEDPHSSLMGLHLAQKARKSGTEVTVFLNVHGVRLVGSAADTLAFHGENLQGVLKDLMGSGGAVLACPHCMEAHGVMPDQLPEGVKVMDDALMMEKIGNHPVVFTY
jgi:predicted peroxiredoxin